MLFNNTHLLNFPLNSIQTSVQNSLCLPCSRLPLYQNHLVELWGQERSRPVYADYSTKVWVPWVWEQNTCKVWRACRAQVSLNAAGLVGIRQWRKEGRASQIRTALAKVQYLERAFYVWKKENFLWVKYRAEELKEKEAGREGLN